MMRRLRGSDFHFDILGRARVWFLLSGIILAVSLSSLALRGINAGLEFRGGTAFQLQARGSDVTVADVKGALEEAGVGGPTVQEVGDQGFLVQTEHLSPSVQSRALRSLADLARTDRNEINVTDVGPKWGAQITNKAFQALVVFLVVLVVYLSIRLEPKMAVAALLGLFHDLLATAGIYSLSGFEVTPATVIALLTILGFSLYDTVVVFDRVKERTTNLSAAGRVTYTSAVNAALNEVLIRSLNTSVVSLLPVGSLLVVGSYLLGAHTLRELALALLIGIGVGMYSPIAISTPILAKWKEREQRWATLRARIEARGAEPSLPPPPPRPAVPAPVVTPTSASPPAQATATAAAGGGGGGATSGGSRSRKRKRRKRRRR
jgi:preprotein translocase subunit SecF